MSKRGMTLVEVVISLAILSVISIYTAQSIRTAVRSKKKSQDRIERTSQLRDVLEIVKSDVNKAFHYRDPSIQVYNQAWEKRIKEAEKKEGSGSQDKNQGPGGGGGQSGPQGSKPRSQILREQYKEKKQRVKTHFVGDAESMHFTSLNNARVSRNAKQSNQMEVGYFVRSCKGRINKRDTTDCLWRRTANVLDDEVEEGGSETVLIDNVEEFSLRYTSQDFEEEWVEQWTSKDQALDDRTKANFPEAVEVTLRIKDQDNENDNGFGMTVLAKVRLPNNPKPQKPETPNGEQQAVGP